MDFDLLLLFDRPDGVVRSAGRTPVVPATNGFFAANVDGALGPGSGMGLTDTAAPDLSYVSIANPGISPTDEMTWMVLVNYGSNPSNLGRLFDWSNITVYEQSDIVYFEVPRSGATSKVGTANTFAGENVGTILFFARFSLAAGITLYVGRNGLLENQTVTISAAGSGTITTPTGNIIIANRADLARSLALDYIAAFGYTRRQLTVEQMAALTRLAGV